MAYMEYWRSTQGFLTGLFPPPERLAIIHSDSAEPSAGSSTDMSLWTPHYYDQTALVTVDDYSNMEGFKIITAHLWEYLDGTSVANKKIFMEFRVKDSTLAPVGGYVALTLLCWAEGLNMRIKPAKSIYGGQHQLISRVELNAERLIGVSQSMIFVAGSFARNQLPLYGVGVYDIGLGGSETNGNIYYMTHENFGILFGGDPSGEEVDPDLGPESEPGGYGPGGGGSGGPGPTFDGTSDPWIDYPKLPGIAGLGLVNLYKCDVGSLVNLGAELFPDIHFPTSLSDVGAVIAAVSDSIWNSKLIDYIVSAHIVPIDVDTGSAALEDIKVGTRTMTGILARKITDDVVEFDCGTVKIDEYYTNFVDFLGSVCHLYLPFYGMIELKPEYWQSATVSVKYLFNVIDGSFVAQVMSEIDRHQSPCKIMVGQYTGCACVHVPMTGSEYASMFGGMIANAGGMAAGVSTGNAALAATSALNMSSGLGSGGGAQMSNAYNASAGFYGYPAPYLMIERQISQFSARYPQEKGFPLLVAKTIGACRGFTTAEDIILDGIHCTSEEKERIRNYFKTGVIIR